MEQSVVSISIIMETKQANCILIVSYLPRHQHSSRLLCVSYSALHSQVSVCLTDLTEQGGTLLCHLTPGYLLLATKDFNVNHSVNFYPSLLDVIY